MIEAYLYWDMMTHFTRPMILEGPVEVLRIKAAHPLEEELVHDFAGTATTFYTMDASSTDALEGITVRHRKPHLIFKRWKDLGNGRYAYLLDGLSDFRSHSLRVAEPGVLDIGFDEPDEDVNLHKLAEKFRDSAPVKELLLKYYNRN
jgi:hypothetical protein